MWTVGAPPAALQTSQQQELEAQTIISIMPIYIYASKAAFDGAVIAHAL